MSDPRPSAPRNLSRRMFLGGAGVAALGITALETAAPGTALAAQAGKASVRPAALPSPAGPRPYFPADVTQIPPTASLPDLFTFFGRTASPNPSGRVTGAADWPARAAELSDLM